MGRVRDLGRMGDPWVGAGPDGAPLRGVALSGSTNVRVNDLPALRTGDVGVAFTPAGPRLWRAVRGASRTRVNGELLHRAGDLTLVEGAVGHVRGREGVADVAGADRAEPEVPSAAYRVKRRRGAGGELVDWLYVRAWGDGPSAAGDVVAGVIFSGETFHAAHRSPDGRGLWGRGDGRRGGYTGYGFIAKADEATGRPAVGRVRATPPSRLEAFDPAAPLRRQVHGVDRLYGDGPDGVAARFRRGAEREMFHRRGGGAWVELDAGERLRVRYRTRDGWCMARAERDGRWGFVRESAVDLGGAAFLAV